LAYSDDLDLIDKSNDGLKSLFNQLAEINKESWTKNKLEENRVYGCRKKRQYRKVCFVKSE